MAGKLHHALNALGRTPGLLQWRKRQFERAFVAGQVPGTCRGVYPSFAAAAAAAPKTRPLGYDQPDAGKMYRDRLERIYPSDYAMMVWVQKMVNEGARRVVDLGGHIGLSYYAYERMLDLPADLTWRVCDVPSVVAAGRAEAEQRDRSRRLSFTEHFAEASQADLLFTAGCVQFLEDPLAERIAKLAKRPRWLLVNLLPLSRHPDYWTVQSIGIGYCPYRIQNDARFFSSLEALGYRLRDKWENLEKDCWIAYEPEYSLDRYWGAALELG